MATQKALLTNKADFIESGIGGVISVDPFLFCNAEDLPSEVTVVGTSPTYIDGIRGKAVQHGGVTAYKWENWDFPSATKHMISFWFQPTANDLSGWKILATHRGDGWANWGLHLAVYNGELNARMYGNEGMVSVYTDGTDGQATFTFTAGNVYHICLIYDQNATNVLEVYVNDELMLYSQTLITLGAFTRSFTVGDMLDSYGNLSYTVDGWIDEVIYALDGEVWTATEKTDYYNGINNKKFVDYSTNPGAIQLPDDGTGQYVPGPNIFISETLDLGSSEPFGDYGRVQMVYSKPDACTLNIYTRASNDGLTWDEWLLIDQDGYINSANKRYYQIKVQFTTDYLGATPVIEELQILSYTKMATQYVGSTEPLKVYKDLATGLEYMGVLNNAYDIIIAEEINGEDIISFKLPKNDPKRVDLGDEPVELIVEIAGRRYTLKEAIDKRDNDGKLFTEFNGEALWYELRDNKVKSIDLQKVSAYTAMNRILDLAVEPTNWTINRCEIDATKTRDIKGEWKSVLELLRKIVDLYGGDLVFDTQNRQINLYKEYGEDNGVRFYYNKNLKSITRTVDTYDLVTKLYPYGQGGLSIATVNNGVEYIEDYTWVDALGLRNRVRVGRWKDNNYIYAQNLLEDAQIILADSAKPQIAYVVEVQDLSALSGHEHESFNLGDTVYTVDKDLLSTEVKSRIVRRELNIREPWKTVVELAQPKKLLSDAVRKSVDENMEYLETAGDVATVDAQQMTVFNHLLNSRADEGINSDWIQTGTDFSVAEGGFSGDWCFKCNSVDYGRENVLSQRVYGVSHRTAYTVSAAVATDGQVTRGGTIDEPFVGIRVVIHYKDGTSETKYLAIPDVTQK